MLVILYGRFSGVFKNLFLIIIHFFLFKLSLLSRLFSVIKNRQSRVELCNIFKSIMEKVPSYEFIYKTVHDVKSNS